jgi:hypothetical protein
MAQKLSSPEADKPLPYNNIHLSYEFHPARYTGYRAIKKALGNLPGAFSFRMTILSVTQLK